MSRWAGILLILVALGILAGMGWFLWRGGGAATPAPTPTPVPLEVLYTAAQTIPPGTTITPELLVQQAWPAGMAPAGAIRDERAILGQVALTYIVPGQIFVQGMLAPPEQVGGGSLAASLLQPGEVAIALPVDKLSSLGYGLRPGDYVDILLGLLFTDLDQIFQSRLPDQVMVLTVDQQTGQYRFTPAGALGRKEQLEGLNVPVYVVPQEKQRPRLVTQLTVQRARVLMVGEWPLPGAMVLPPSGAGDFQQPEASPTPAPAPTRALVPNVVTLAVSPQDAVAIEFMLLRGARLTLVLRNANDTALHDTQAVTLDFIMNAYGVPVPAKLPYDLAYPADYGLPPTPTPTPVPPED